MNQQQDPDLELKARWNNSREKLNNLARERKQFTDEEHSLFRERKKLVPSNDTDGQRANRISIRLGELRVSIPSSGHELVAHRKAHQALCDSINLNLGAGTVRHWQRERRKETPRKKHLASSPLVVSEKVKVDTRVERNTVAMSPDSKYGESGTFSFA